jgi:hypothetical protein
MKKLVSLIIATMFFIPAVSFAKENTNKVCSYISTFAEAVMTLRQEGVKMSTQIEALDVFKSSPPEIRKLFKGIIIAAYSMPRFSTESVKRETIQEFSNMVYLECIKRTMED